MPFPISTSRWRLSALLAVRGFPPSLGGNPPMMGGTGTASISIDSARGGDEPASGRCVSRDLNKETYHDAHPPSGRLDGRDRGTGTRDTCAGRSHHLPGDHRQAAPEVQEDLPEVAREMSAAG